MTRMYNGRLFLPVLYMDSEEVDLVEAIQHIPDPQDEDEDEDVVESLFVILGSET